MSSTTQDTPPDDATGSLPADQTPPEPKEARPVPLPALAEARQKARESQERIKQLEAELAQTKNSQQPAAAAQPQPEFTKLAKEVEAIQQRERRRQVAHELGLSDDKQTDVVLDLLTKNSDLNPTEALELAAKRKPDLFKERGQPGFDPRVHGSTRPRVGTPPEPEKSDRQKRLEAMGKATGSDKDELMNNYIGSIAARTMGWGKEHKKIPI